MSYEYCAKCLEEGTEVERAWWVLIGRVRSKERTVDTDDPGLPKPTGWCYRVDDGLIRDLHLSTYNEEQIRGVYRMSGN